MDGKGVDQCPSFLQPTTYHHKYFTVRKKMTLFLPPVGWILEAPFTQMWSLGFLQATVKANITACGSGSGSGRQFLCWSPPLVRKQWKPVWKSHRFEKLKKAFIGNWRFPQFHPIPFKQHPPPLQLPSFSLSQHNTKDIGCELDCLKITQNQNQLPLIEE